MGNSTTFEIKGQEKVVLKMIFRKEVIDKYLICTRNP